MLHVPEVQWTVVGALEPLEHQLPQIPYSLSSLYFSLRGLLYFCVGRSLSHATLQICSRGSELD